MDETGAIGGRPWRNVDWPTRLIPLAVGAMALVAAVFYLQFLPLLLFAIIVAGLSVAMLRWPDIATLLGIALVYSNLAVVAVKFHGAPAVLPALVLGILVWPVAFKVVVQKQPILLGSASPFLLLFMVVQFLGAVLCMDPPKAFGNFISFLLEGACLYFIVTNAVRDRRTAVSVFWTLAACAFVMAIGPLLQQVTGNVESNFGGLAQVDSAFQTSEDAIEGTVQQQRAAGTIGEQNRYAQFMVLLVPITFTLISISSSPGLKALASVATLTALGGFVLAFSRGAAVGLVLAFGVAVWLKLIGRKQVVWAVVGAAFILLLFPQYLVRLSSLVSLTSSLSSNSGGLGQADGAVRGRLTEMGAAAMVFRDHLLIGVGPAMFPSYSQDYGQVIGLRSLAEGRQAHSLILDIAAEHGLFGLVAICGIFAAVIRQLALARAMALQRNDEVGQLLVTAMLLAVMLYIVTAFFLHLSYIRYFWLLIALADAIAYIVLQPWTNESNELVAS